MELLTDAGGAHALSEFVAECLAERDLTFFEHSVEELGDGQYVDVASVGRRRKLTIESSSGVHFLDILAVFVRWSLEGVSAEDSLDGIRIRYLNWEVEKLGLDF